jgi:hypothetical protein
MRYVEYACSVVSNWDSQIFRDAEGNSTNSPGLQLRLSDFASYKIANDQLGSEDREIRLSSHQLSQCLKEAEFWDSKESQTRPITPPGVIKNRR